MSVKLRCDYDFNSPADHDGMYRVVAPEFLVDRPAVGDEIVFGDSEVWADGVVRRVYRILIVERTSPIEAAEPPETETT